MQEPFKLKSKHYIHFDLPLLSKAEIDKIEGAVKNTTYVGRHAFLPLICRKQITFPFRMNSQNGKKVFKKKVRTIMYASHHDAAIYSYYAYILQDQYEKFLDKEGLNDVSVAYRKIKKDNSKSGKCNIDIAKDVFDIISRRLDNGEDISVITFDVKGFFDNLDHSLLKKQWIRMMRWSGYMPDDTYNVFKSITRYSFVYEDDAFQCFKNRIICKTDGNTRCVKSQYYLRDKGAIAYCNAKDIKTLRSAHLIRTRGKGEHSKKGIPQGLAISAVLANIYMSDFDRRVNVYVHSLGGIYKRYSDDIIIVCPKTKGTQLRQYVIKEIKEEKLEIEERKTNLFYMYKQNDQIICEHETEGSKRTIEYLGFSFDGNRILMKDATLGKYYNRLDKALRRSRYHAATIHNSTQGKIFNNQILQRFSFIGAKPHKIYIRSKFNKSKFVDSKRRSYGNFLTYVRKASDIMQDYSILGQISRNRNIVRKKIKEAEQAIYGNACLD